MIGALRDHGLSRHADDCEMDIWEKDVELLQSPRMKARTDQLLGNHGDTNCE